MRFFRILMAAAALAALPRSGRNLGGAFEPNLARG
jgi:hypothetical protein